MDATSPGTIQKDEHALLFPEAGASTTWPASRRYVQLIHRINRLRMAGIILHLGSHPDDEDSGMLAYMSHRYGMRSVYLSATLDESRQHCLMPEKAELNG